MAQCPKCHSENVHRSRTRSRWERWRRDVTGKRPHRCHACNWRGWFRGELGLTDRLVFRGAPEAPNFRGTLLARTDPRLHVDLKKLDAFHSLPDKDDA